MQHADGLTEDGIERQFGTNHIGHFLLTNLLLPKLHAANDPVVVNLTSSAHRFGSGEYSNVNFTKGPYDPWTAYGNSKSANVLFAKSLAKREIRGVACNPGCASFHYWFYRYGAVLIDGQG